MNKIINCILNKFGYYRWVTVHYPDGLGKQKVYSTSFQLKYGTDFKVNKSGKVERSHPKH